MATYRTAEELATRTIGDAERIALTLIEKHLEDGVPTFAESWLRSVLSDTTFAQHSDLQEQVKGYREYLEERDDVNFSTAWDQHIYVERSVDALEAGIMLADAVVTHRLIGDPDRDHTVSLGFGLSVTTSLAAAAVNYTRQMMQVMGRR